MTPELLALHRYFIWANRMRVHFDEKAERMHFDEKDFSFESSTFESATSISDLYSSWIRGTMQ